MILLLPLQVFAGAVEDRMALSQETQQTGSEATIELISALVPAQSLHSPGQWDFIPPDNGAAIDLGQNDSPGDEPTEDLASHAVFGDEAVPASFLIFALQSPQFISALHNDAASIPPYLPPAARPPKI